MRNAWLSTHVGLMAVFAAVLTLCVRVAPGQTATTFTYQGRLDEGGVPANGTYDMRFSVRDVATGTGTLLSLVVCRDGVEVTDGLFDVDVDLGVGAWLSANDAFVQVEVRQDATGGNCGTGVYTELSPRSRLTAAPRSASTRGVLVSQDGKIGLGGSFPVRGLALSGGVLVQDLGGEGIALSTDDLEVSDTNGEVAYRYNAPPLDRHEFLNAGEPTLSLTPGGFIGLGTQSPNARVHMVSALNRPSYARIESSRIVPPGTALSTSQRTPAAANVVSLPNTWTSLDAARVSDGILASSAATGAGGQGSYTSQAVRLSGFGFAVPSNATITGLTITVNTNNQISYGCPALSSTTSVRVTPRASAIVGTTATAPVMLSSPSTATIGGMSQAFGQAWTPAQINNASFAIDVDFRLGCTNLTSDFMDTIPCSCGPSGFYRIDGVSVVVHYVIGAATVAQSTWSVGVGSGKSTFVLAPTADLSSPSLVLTPDGRVGMGVEPTGNTGPRLDVAGQVRCVNLIETSSARFKTDVATLSSPLDSVLALRPVRFRWDTAHGGRDDIGFIAEQVQTIAPALVTTDQSGETMGMNYGRIGVLAVGAIQELKNQHDQQLAELQARAERLDAENADLKARLLQLEQRLNAMSGNKQAP